MTVFSLYRLIDRLAVPCDSLAEWAASHVESERRVGATDVGELRVSTVFLGIDHRIPEIEGAGDPLLFETMIFGPDGTTGSYQTRCSTWDQAEDMHAAGIETAQRWLARAAVDTERLRQIHGKDADIRRIGARRDG